MTERKQATNQTLTEVYQIIIVLSSKVAFRPATKQREASNFRKG